LIFKGFLKTSGVTIIFSPSSILIKNHCQFLNSLNIRAEIIDGTVRDLHARDDIRAEIEQNDSQIRFLFVIRKLHMQME
jgi:superfamily II DNA helicase RecQ